MLALTLSSPLTVNVQDARATPPLEQAPLKTAERPSPTVSRTEVPAA